MKSATISIVALALMLSAGCEKGGVGSGKVEKRKYGLENTGSVTIEQGGTASLTVTVTRDEGFTDALTMTLGKLPSGVTLVSGEKEVKADEAAYTFKADENAKPITGVQVAVTVKGETGHPWASWFGITIAAKPEEEPAKAPEPAAETEDT